jgi:hypothetical protein
MQHHVLDALAKSPTHDACRPHDLYLKITVWPFSWKRYATVEWPEAPHRRRERRAEGKQSFSRLGPIFE